jgi:hypothetical protein
MAAASGISISWKLNRLFARLRKEPPLPSSSIIHQSMKRSAMPEALPVIDLLNNVITTNDYLRASGVARLADAIVQNPIYASLVSNFTEWQYQLWDDYYAGLINGTMIPQAQEIARLYQLGVATQSDVQSVLFPEEGDPTPSFVSQCDDIANLIASGNTLVESLDTIAQSIENADQQQVDALLQLANTLNSQFSQQEDQLTEKAISSGFDLVCTVIDVGVAVASDGAALQPLINGVTKIGQDVIGELALTGDIKQTLSQLESAWKALDEATAALAQITLTTNQLNAVVASRSATLQAINNLVTDWTTVANVVTGSASDWAASGSDAVNEWASRMIKVSFATASQSVGTAS